MSGFFRNSRALYSAAEAVGEYRKPRISTTVATAATPRKRPSPTPAATVATAATPRKHPSPTPAATAATPTKRPIPAFMKEMPVSPLLSSFVGASQISHHQATKKIWEHIKANNLQNPKNKRVIICDDKLKKLFDGRDKVGMLEIAKLLSPHFVKASA